jgi:hypothetical protein
MTFRQINNNILKEYFQTRSIKEVAKKIEINEALIQGILFTRGIVDDEGVDLGLTKALEIEDAFGFEEPESVLIRIELNFVKLTAKEKRILEKYGHAKNARIYRDIIIPPNFTLHQLNYVIQQSFGWKNYHLHDFLLKQKDFKKITRGKFKEWCDLCGVYFRFPDADDQDLYWDDDYEEGVDYKEYFASKYTGNYEYGALGDYFLENQLKVKSFNEHNRMIPIHPPLWLDSSKKDGNKIASNEISTIKPLESTLEELKFSSIMLEGKFESLIESLEVTKVLVPYGRKLPDYKLFKNEMIKQVIKENKTTLKQDLEQFVQIRNDLFKVIADREKVEQSIKEGQFDVVTSWNERMDKASIDYQELVEDTQPPTMPVTDEIIYEYDFGDGWEVSIKSVESYYDDSDYFKDALGKYSTNKVEIHDSKGDTVSDELAQKIVDVINDHKPICIDSSGVNLLDDVGGPIGFINMLRELNEPSSKETFENIKEWAFELMSWNQSEIVPDTLL